MSVGGRLIEMRPYTLRDRDNPAFSRDVLRLWVVDRSGDETIVYADPSADVLPVIGDDIWWQAGKIYFNQDKNSLVKIAYSHSPH